MPLIKSIFLLSVVALNIPTAAADQDKCETKAFGGFAVREERVRNLVDAEVSAANTATAQGRLSFTLYGGPIVTGEEIRVRTANQPQSVGRLYADLLDFAIGPAADDAPIQHRVAALRILGGLPRLATTDQGWEDVIKRMTSEISNRFMEVQPSLAEDKKFGLGSLRISFFPDRLSETFQLEEYYAAGEHQKPQRWHEILRANGMSEQMRMLLELSVTMMAITPRNYNPVTTLALEMISMILKIQDRFTRTVAFYYHKPNQSSNQVFAFGYEGLPRLSSALLRQGGNIGIRSFLQMAKTIEDEPPADMDDEEDDVDEEDLQLDATIVQSRGPTSVNSLVFHLLAAAFRDLNGEMPINHLLHDEVLSAVNIYGGLARRSPDTDRVLDIFSDSSIRRMLVHTYFYERMLMAQEQTELTRKIQIILKAAQLEQNRPLLNKEIGQLGWYVSTLLELSGLELKLNLNHDAAITLTVIQKILTDTELHAKTNPTRAKALLVFLTNWIMNYKNGKFGSYHGVALQQVGAKAHQLCRQANLVCRDELAKAFNLVK